MATVPLSGMRNVRNVDSETQRRRQAKRAGHRRLFDATMPGPVQELGVIEVASSVSGYRVVNCNEPGDFESRSSGPLTGQLFMLSNTLSMYRDFYDPRDTGSLPIPHVAIIPGTDRVVYVINYRVVVGTPDFYGFAVVCVDEKGNTVWTTLISDDSPINQNYYANRPAADSDYVYVPGLADTLGGRLWLLKVSDGSLISPKLGDAWDGCYGWANECVAVESDGTNVFVLMRGAGFAAQAPNQAAGVNIDSSDFRSGIMKFVKTGDDADALHQEQFGPVLPDSDPWYEANHGYLRFFEQSRTYPWGTLPTDMALGSDGSIMVVSANQGWGPNGSWPPNGSAAYVSVRKISSNGYIDWEADPQTLREQWGSPSDWWFADYGYMYNDRNDPTLKAVAINKAGYAIVAGRRNAASATDGRTATEYRVSDGLERWTYNSSGTIQEGCAAADPADNSFWIGGVRNADWLGNSGNNAHYWHLASDTPTVLDIIDLGNVSGLGVKVGDEGKIVISTDKL